MQDEDASKPVKDGERTARRKINQHLWKFHDHARGMGDTSARYIFHENLHAEGRGPAGKPRHVHMSDFDLDVIMLVDE